jgi:5-(carboxyamino)imidazole ribonucleotide synthase
VTFDHEHVPQDVLARLEESGVAVRPGRVALEAAQDKIRMRERLTALGVPVPAWAVAAEAADVAEFLAAHGGRAVVKTPRGGYDGKGVRVVADVGEVADWLLDGPLLVEELVPFRRELAQQIARRPSGQTASWPLVETVQRDGVCAEVLAPAPDSAAVADEAQHIAETIAEGLGVVGALAVELFETTDGRLLVNELAMRPHNSGHWTIDGAITSQFEQHLRAVLDLPLGDPAPLVPVSVMVNVLGGPAGATMPDRYPAAFAAHPEVKFHSYGKESRPGRKVGHVTATGTDLDEVRARARAAAGFFDR